MRAPARALLILNALLLPALAAPALLCCAALVPVHGHDCCPASAGDPEAAACCEGDGSAQLRLGEPLPASPAAAILAPPAALTGRATPPPGERSRAPGSAPLYSLHHALLI